jgi:hypothetical protein
MSEESDFPRALGLAKTVIEHVEKWTSAGATSSLTDKLVVDILIDPGP